MCEHLIITTLGGDATGTEAVVTAGTDELALRANGYPDATVHIVTVDEVAARLHWLYGGDRVAGWDDLSEDRRRVFRDNAAEILISEHQRAL
ncbi:hypothetical protein [Aeromicrobium sp. CTD01-1L150]|uniref:hypothetical protein n=1 Tax=Aeromicrobium sp. CTD01-1L150 TaxID=3341830 RepID=UPI0035C20480